MVAVVSSDQTAQQNFRYVFTIYVDDDFDGVFTALPSIRRSPDSVTGYGVLDMHRILENYVGSNITKGIMNFTRCEDSWVSYYLKVEEEYGATPAIGSSITYSEKFAYNAYFSFSDFFSYAQGDWIIGVGASPSMLTVATSGVITVSSVKSTVANTFRIRPAQDAWAYCITNTSGSCYFAYITTYNTAGTVLGVYRLQNPFQAITAIKDRYVRFPTGTNFLASAVAGSDYVALSGSIPAYTSSVSHYSVQIYDFFSNETSAKIWYILDENCTRNPVYRLHFLNVRGGFDSANFIRASRNTIDIKRDTFKKGIGALSTTAWGYSQSDRADVQFYTQLKQKTTVLSDWLSESESLWLQQLFASPEVYYDDGSKLIAVNVKNPSYEIKQRENDELISWTIDLEYSSDNYTQRF